MPFCDLISLTLLRTLKYFYADEHDIRLFLLL